MPIETDSAPAALRPLAPDEEWGFLQELYRDEAIPQAMALLRDSYTTLQVRSQTLLGLITICLTITGFSGIRLAADTLAARVCMLAGILGVLVAAVILFAGPLQLRWHTQARAATVPATIIALLHRRNTRTRQYHAAVVCLLVGLTGYVLSIVAYLGHVGR